MASGQSKNGQVGGGSGELGSWHSTCHSSLKERPGLGGGGERVYWTGLSWVGIWLPLLMSSGQEASNPVPVFLM